jgi:Uma2 family endonuclease
MTLLTQPSIAPPRDLLDDRAIFMPFTVDQYHWMIEHGVFPEGEPYELLDGYLIRKDRSAAGEDPMTVGPERGLVIVNLTDLTPKLRRLGCHVRIQLPVTLPPWNEPEPDTAIVLGDQRDYTGRHPGAADVTCVIEVADSSLHRDRTVKLGIYAGSGIPCYIIVNLPDRTVEVYTQPFNGKGRVGRYGQSITLTGRQTVELPTAGGKRLSVAARRLLP